MNAPDLHAAPTGTPSPQAERAAPVSPDTIAPPNAEESRLRPIREYRTAVLTDSDSLLASVGSHNSGLLLIGHHLEEAIMQVLTSGNDVDARLSKVLPALDTHLRVSRQVDRFTQLALRVTTLRRELAQKFAIPKPTPPGPFPGLPVRPLQAKI